MAQSKKSRKQILAASNYTARPGVASAFSATQRAARLPGLLGQRAGQFLPRSGWRNGQNRAEPG
jgi:hypothetical protein